MYTVAVSETHFEWSNAKDRANQRKHGVSFAEAQVLLGLSSSSRTLVVCHCYRSDDEVVRIISARKANARERRTYTERWTP
jgi:uncharacterized protein